MLWSIKLVLKLDLQWYKINSNKRRWYKNEMFTFISAYSKLFLIQSDE